MKNFIANNIEKIVFAVMLMVVAFVYGVAVGEYKLFPYGLSKNGAKSARDLYHHWRSYAGVEPTKYLQPARLEGNGVTIRDPQRAYPGLTFMSGLFDRKVALQLVDLDGKVVHRWIPDHERIWGETAGSDDLYEDPPFNEWDVGIMGAQLLPDGGVIFNYANIAVKLDKCSNPEWVLPYPIHHSLMASEDGTFWASGRRMVLEPKKELPKINPAFVEDVAVQFSSTGEIMQTIPLVQMLFANDLEAALYSTGEELPKNTEVDFTHLNDIEVLQSADAAAFPMFEAGDILASLRDVNLVFVFDPKTLKVKWYQNGPWLRQHDPDFLPDGTISVFNNRKDDTERGTIFGGSNIMVVDPKTGETRVAYEGSADHPFYTNSQGSHQYLPNGNYIITETKGGRIFEVDKSGEIVWEFISRYDDHRVAQIQDGARIPEDYFTVDDWSCN